MSGYDVARALREEPATRHVRLIALTGYGRTEDRTPAAREAGFDHHLTKPVGIADLKRALSPRATWPKAVREAERQAFGCASSVLAGADQRGTFATIIHSAAVSGTVATTPQRIQCRARRQ